VLLAFAGCLQKQGVVPSSTPATAAAAKAPEPAAVAPAPAPAADSAVKDAVVDPAKAPPKAPASPTPSETPAAPPPAATVAARGDAAAVAAVGTSDAVPPAPPAAGGGGDGVQNASEAGEKKDSPKAAQVAKKDASPSEGEKASPAKEAADAPLGSDLPEAGRKAFEELREIQGRIPVVFANLKRTPQEIEADLLRAVEVAQAFLKEEAHKKSPALRWVQAYLARNLFSRIQKKHAEIRDGLLNLFEAAEGRKPDAAERRQIEEAARNDLGAYREDIERLAKDVMASVPAVSEPRCVALSVLADIAFSHTRDFQAHRKYALEFIESCETCLPGRDFRHSVGQSYIFEGNYAGARKYIEKEIEKHRDRDEFVLYNMVHFEACEGMGDLTCVEELMHRIQEEYPRRLEKADLDQQLRIQYSQWFNISDFWIGYALYAQGEVEGALKAFKSCVERIDAMEQKLAQERRKLPGVEQVFRDFRARDYIDFIENLHGKKPLVDLDRGVEWASQKQATFSGLKGKVVPVLFRLPKYLKAETFLLEIEALSRQDGVQGVWLAFYPSALNQDMRQQRIDAMQEEIANLELTLPSGFDETPNQEIVRTLHGTVGTPSFVLLDTEGNFAWYLVDASNKDRANLVRVVERLRKTKAP
jgi:tetratricopeptide (TPR) repeat protein